MKINRLHLTLFLCAMIGFGSLRAQHTFSIVAVDPATGEVGSAGATCLTSADCGGCGGAVIISGVVPGRGAINAQATVCIPNSNLNNGINLMQGGSSPQQILNSLLLFDNCQFGDTSTRQYGIADLDTAGNPRTASFSGSGTMSYSNHITGPNYSVQGNILLGPQILADMEQGFLNTPGPLCEKLMGALQGANVPGADTRCLDDSISSKSSFIRVAKPTDTQGNLWLEIIVGSTDSLVDPIDSLQTLFDDWKLVNDVADPYTEAPLKLWPNPTDGVFRVDFSMLSPIDPIIRIYDLQGREIRNFSLTRGSRNADIDLRAAGAGLYSLVYIDKKRSVYRTVKVKVE